MNTSTTKIFVILCFVFMDLAGSDYLFERQRTWPTVSENEYTTLTVKSELDCASHVNAKDFGFAFNHSDKSCHLLHCANPNVTNSTAKQEMSETDIYLRGSLTPNYLLARGKPASMSTVFSSAYEAWKAVDGVYLPPQDDLYSSLVHTALDDNNPWWRVDLEQVHCIWGVNILNRALYDEISEPLRNRDVDVTVSRDETLLSYDTNPDSRCNYFDGPLNIYYTLIYCVQPMRGQFVQIQYRPSADSVINLYEIEVFGL